MIGTISRTVVASSPLDTTMRKLADNSKVIVTREELQEALQLAGAAQTSTWMA